MIDVLIPITLVILTGLFEYGCLLLAGKQRSTLWRNGIWAGMAGSGMAAFGFGAPHLNPWPWQTFAFGTLIMIISVFYSYYKLYPTATELEAERRHGIIRELGVGMVFSLFLIIIVAFMQGQSSSVVIQEKVATKLDTLLSNQSGMTGQLQNVENRLITVSDRVSNLEARFISPGTTKTRDVKKNTTTAKSLNYSTATKKDISTKPKTWFGKLVDKLF